MPFEMPFAKTKLVWDAIWDAFCQNNWLLATIARSIARGEEGSHDSFGNRKTVLRNSAASRGDPQHECVIVFLSTILYTESDCKSYFQTVMTGSCVTPKGMVAVEPILNCPYSNVWSEMSRPDMFESSSAQMLSADFWFKTNEVVRSVGLDTAQRIIIK